MPGVGIDFIYLDGVVADCGRCHIAEAALVSDALKRLGNGMVSSTTQWMAIEVHKQFVSCL